MNVLHSLKDYLYSNLVHYCIVSFTFARSKSTDIFVTQFFPQTAGSAHMIAPPTCKRLRALESIIKESGRASRPVVFSNYIFDVSSHCSHQPVETRLDTDRNISPFRSQRSCLNGNYWVSKINPTYFPCTQIALARRGSRYRIFCWWSAPRVLNSYRHCACGTSLPMSANRSAAPMSPKSWKSSIRATVWGSTFAALTRDSFSRNKSRPPAPSSPGKTSFRSLKIRRTQSPWHDPLKSRGLFTNVRPVLMIVGAELPRAKTPAGAFNHNYILAL